MRSILIKLIICLVLASSAAAEGVSAESAEELGRWESPDWQIYQRWRAVTAEEALRIDGLIERGAILEEMRQTYKMQVVPALQAQVETFRAGREACLFDLEASNQAISETFDISAEIVEIGDTQQGMLRDATRSIRSLRTLVIGGTTVVVVVGVAVVVLELTEDRK